MRSGGRSAFPALHGSSRRCRRVNEHRIIRGTHPSVLCRRILAQACRNSLRAQAVIRTCCSNIDRGRHRGEGANRGKVRIGSMTLGRRRRRRRRNCDAAAGTPRVRERVPCRRPQSQPPLTRQGLGLAPFATERGLALCLELCRPVSWQQWLVSLPQSQEALQREIPSQVFASALSRCSFTALVNASALRSMGSGGKAPRTICRQQWVGNAEAMPRCGGHQGQSAGNLRTQKIRPASVA